MRELLRGMACETEEAADGRDVAKKRFVLSRPTDLVQRSRDDCIMNVGSVCELVWQGVGGAMKLILKIDLY